ncbi:hypothetical protein LCGC14_1856120, partial [marine sediment metagenome]
MNRLSQVTVPAQDLKARREIVSNQPSVYTAPTTSQLAAVLSATTVDVVYAQKGNVAFLTARAREPVMQKNLQSSVHVGTLFTSSLSVRIREPVRTLSLPPSLLSLWRHGCLFVVAVINTGLAITLSLGGWM